MASAINPAMPIYGSPTTQSVRDNFQHAHDEITALQALGPFLPLIGGEITGQLQVDGNVRIGQTVDAGFQLDVNGSARITGALFANTGTFNTTTVAPPALPAGRGAGIRLLGDTNTSVATFVDVFGNNGGAETRRANGTPSVPTGLLANQAIMHFSALGHDGTAYSTGSQASFQIRSYNPWGTADHSTSYQWSGTSAGSTTQTYWMGLYNGNLLVGPSVDSGYKLDVSGAARITSVLLAADPTLALQAVTKQYSDTNLSEALDPLFGTGVDGTPATINGNTNLSRDMCYTNLTIGATGSLRTNGWRVFVSGTLDISAAGPNAIVRLKVNGNSATTALGASAVGAIPGNFTVGGGSIAGNGGTGNTTTGTAATAGTVYPVAMGDGGASGVGGAGTSVGGASALGGVATVTGARAQLSLPTVNLTCGQNNAAPSGNVAGGLGGGGGGPGGGDGTGAGGGGGSGGAGSGVVAIYARTIARGSNTNVGIISAQGGNGGNGANAVGANAGGGAGGGGGGGGYVYIVCEQLTGSTIANCIDVSGGAGGTGGNGQGTGKGGNGGNGGNGGAANVIVLKPNAVTVSSFNAAGTAGSTTSTTTGATGGAGAVVQMNL